MPPLTAIVIACNEEANIGDCLRSLAWLDSVIVVDSGSTDNTCAVAEALGAAVVFHPWAGYSAQKNFAHTLVSSDWILSIDADERVSAQLQNEITEVLDSLPADSPIAAYRVPIRDWMFGKCVNYGSWPLQKHVRLYRRGKVTWVGAVHEGQTIDGEVRSLSAPLLHYSHTSISRFIDKLNKYTELEAEEMFRQGRHVPLASALLGAGRAFLGQYVRLQGFRDGGHGLILAVLMAAYYFVTRAKLWTRWYIQEYGDRS
jgi:glycosyltransferase involved in cell wall biosynthesis